MPIIIAIACGVATTFWIVICLFSLWFLLKCPFEIPQFNVRMFGRTIAVASRLAHLFWCMSVGGVFVLSIIQIIFLMKVIWSL